MIILEKVSFNINRYFQKIIRGKRSSQKNSNERGSSSQLKNLSAKDFLVASRKKFSEIRIESQSKYKKFD